MNFSEFFKPPEPPETLSASWDSPAAKLYGEGIRQITRLIRAIQTDQTKTFFLKPLLAFAEESAALDPKQADTLLSLATRSTPDIYLYAHCVNVAIFALRVGLALGMNRQELVSLGLAALMHDIGMAKKLDLTLTPASLKKEDLAEIQKHSVEGADLLHSFPDLPQDFLTSASAVILQNHERRNGRGYPRGLKGDQIHPLARIVSVCDVYEAITHPRSYRDRILPHKGLQILLESAGDEFEADIVNAAVASLSLYPPGTFVKLNNGTVGKVLSQNAGLPTRPKLRILMDEQGRRLKPPLTQDLALDPLFFIHAAVDETLIKTPDKRLALQLRAQRWWVEGL